MARVVVWALYAYLAVGVSVGPPFVFYAANRTVGGARESGFLFRLFVLPASIVLWPFILGAAGRLRRGDAT